MLDIKKVVIAFIVGFFLSLIFGLIGQVSVGVLFLRAFIFGLLFAGLAYGAFFVFKTFLQTGESSEAPINTSESEDTPIAHTVDIIVDDELPDTQTAPTFEILSDSTQEPEVELQVQNDAPSFKPTTLDSFSKENMMRTNEDLTEPVKNNTVASSPKTTDLSELDELDQLLPSADSFNVSGDEEEDDDFSDDETFTTDSPSLGVTMSVGEPSLSNPPMKENAADMAAAIRTILVNNP